MFARARAPIKRDHVVSDEGGRRVRTWAGAFIRHQNQPPTLRPDHLNVKGEPPLGRSDRVSGSADRAVPTGRRNFEKAPFHAFQVDEDVAAPDAVEEGLRRQALRPNDRRGSTDPSPSKTRSGA